jgi:hypothetical protein
VDVVYVISVIRHLDVAEGKWRFKYLCSDRAQPQVGLDGLEVFFYGVLVSVELHDSAFPANVMGYNCGAEREMKEKEIRERIERFLKRTAQTVVAIRRRACPDEAPLAHHWPPWD